MPQVKANGLDFEIESFGRETDPAILLIMGFSAQMTMWPVSFCQGLADLGFRVIRFDNRDIGKSTHLLDRGAPNPMEAMAVLVTPPASNSREDRIAAGKRIWRTIGSPGYPATDKELDEVTQREVDRVPFEPTGAARQLYAIVVAEPRNEMLKSVRCPTLVIHGADDPLIPVDGGRDTAASIPGAQLVIVPGMAHDFTDALVPVYLKYVGGFVSGVEKAKAAAAQ
jgi:pimeloyl-ACP methyl ester carboxylesterase